MKIDLYQFIAFAIDFEGCIGIEKNIRKTGNSSYHIRVRVSNNSKKLLDEFKNIIKFGEIYGPYKYGTNNKNLYHWSMPLIEVKKYLPLILPFLILKWRQAELVIEILSIIKSTKYCRSLSSQKRKEMYTWEEHMILESCYQECRILNKKKEY